MNASSQSIICSEPLVCMGKFIDKHGSVFYHIVVLNTVLMYLKYNSGKFNG